MFRNALDLRDKVADCMKNAMMEGELLFILLFERQNSFDIIAGL